MGKRGPIPKHKALRVMSGKLPLTKENLVSLDDPKVSAPDMPEHLSAEEKKIWNITVDLLKTSKVLEKVDSAVLEAYCSSYVRWILCDKQIKKDLKVSTTNGLLSDGAGGGVVINPLVNISRRERADTVAFAAQLGMTPSARIRAQVVKETNENPFANLKKNKNNGNMDTKSNKVCRVG